MTRYQSAAHLASWGGMSPGQNESAGKRRNTRTRDGNKYLRSALIESATSCVRKKDSYLSAKYKRLARRRGSKKAIVAIAHHLLVVVYHLLTKREKYKELGSTYYDKEKVESKKQQALNCLKKLGYEINLMPKSA